MERGLFVVDDERFDAHVAPHPHPERPERLDAARSGLARGLEGAPGCAIRVDVEARAARPEELAAIHDPGYVAALDRRLHEGGSGAFDADTYYAPGSHDAAWRAAGGAVALTEAVLVGPHRRGIALLRPPGHHAEGDRAMGFCLLNNVAIAARAALAAGASRVAVIDWDVHHGNGTQHAFEASPEVLFVSLHEWPLYPGTGEAREIGVGAGTGATANLALPSASDDAVYAAAFREVVLPLVRHHAPDVILVSAGFDGHARDPLAHMELGAEGYAAMASALIEAAEGLGHGRVAFFLEGGYDLVALEESVAATARAARGVRTALSEEAISARAREAIERTKTALRAVLPAPVV